MMMLKRTTHQLNPTSTWDIPISSQHAPTADCMRNFDQNGYDLTPLEQLYAQANLCHTESVRWRTAIKKSWFEDTASHTSSVHLNHADLYERKGYCGDALSQITGFAQSTPLIYKLIHMKPKWGIDISIDYVDQHHAYEVFHYEWDDFDIDTVRDKQHAVEQLIQRMDWQDFAKTLWRLRDHWWHLDFAAQGAYRSQLLGISGERFKLTVWN